MIFYFLKKAVESIRKMKNQHASPEQKNENQFHKGSTFQKKATKLSKQWQMFLDQSHRQETGLPFSML